jgi:phosphoglycerate kinase
LKFILDRQGTPILLSHLGRPHGRFEQALSLQPLLPVLESELHQKVLWLGGKVNIDLPRGGIALVENLRFYPEEEHPTSMELACMWAQMGDLYVNDAFAASHRDHTSITKLPLCFPKEKRALGFLMQKEVEALGEIRRGADRPFALCLGGSKVTSKIGLIQGLLPKLDALFIGGAMAFAFLRAQGALLGRTQVDVEEVKMAELILQSSTPIHLPSDLVVTTSLEVSQKSEFRVVSIEEGVPDQMYAVDIGPKTLGVWGPFLRTMKSLIWNGPMGWFEKPPFDRGTVEIAKVLRSMQAKIVVGGGDTLAATRHILETSPHVYLSTGGGASLAFLEKGTLPGLAPYTIREK